MISAVLWHTLPLIAFTMALTPTVGVEPAAAFESNGAAQTVLETKLAPWREPCEDNCVQIPQAKGAAVFLPDDNEAQRVEIGAMIELPIPTSMVGIFDTETARSAAVTLPLCLRMWGTAPPSPRTGPRSSINGSRHGSRAIAPAATAWDGSATPMAAIVGCSRPEQRKSFAVHRPPLAGRPTAPGSPTW